MKPPTISVLIPAFNYGRFLGKAIESTLAQDFTDLELVIVNDASTDNTDAVVEKYSHDERIRYLVNENNLGAVDNINKCFSLATGDYVLLLGADDFLLPGALTALYQRLTQHPESGYAFGYYATADANDRITSIVRHPGHYPLDYSTGRNDLAELLYYDCYVCLGATLFRKSVLDKLGYFDATLRTNDKNQFFRATDYDLVLRFASHGIQSCFVRMPISAFRIHGDQASIGDNYTKDGTQFMEHLVLLERYVTEAHYDRLIGNEKLIIQYLGAKLNTFKQHQQEYLALWPKIEARVQNIVQRLEAISQHYEVPRLLDNPLVTIIVPTKDSPIFLLNALRSLLQQTYTHWEAIVINDGGSSIESLVDTVDTQGRIRYHQLQQSKGTLAARNIALSLAQGDVVCYLNDDDCFLPHHLKTVVDALLKHGCDFVYTDSEYLLEEIRGIERTVVKRMILSSHDQFSLEKLHVENYIPINTWAHRRHCLNKIERFDETMPSSGDWKFLLQITTQFGATHIPIVTTEVHERIEQAGLQQQTPIQQQHINSGNPAHSAVGSDGLNLKPLVSVVLTTYNRPRLLVDALESVIRQTYQNFEIIVVNDCGDDIESVIKQFNTGNRITYIRLGKNSGPAAARNKALAVARGEIITYLDDDDLYYPNHLSAITTKLTDCSSDFVFTGTEQVVERIDADESRIELQRSRPYHGINYSKERLHTSNFIPINGWGHRRSLIDAIGLFDESLTALEDWDFLLRASRQTEIAQIDLVTAEVHTRQSSSDHLSARERPKYSQLYRKIYDRHKDLDNSDMVKSRKRVLEAFDAENDARNSPFSLSEPNSSYQKWLNKTQLSEGPAQLMAERMLHQWKVKPSFHLLMLANPGEEALIADTLESLSTQLYGGWGLSIISSAPMPDVFADAGNNIEWIQDDQDPGGALHETIAATGADWVMVLAPGDGFSAHAIFSFADYANIHPEWNMIYCDEDIRDSAGQRTDPMFKPDCNLEFLRSTDYIGPACAVKGTTLQELGGFSNLAYVYWQDMAFKVIETCGEKALGHIPLVLYHGNYHTRRLKNEDLCCNNERIVRYEHFLRINIAADLNAGLKPNCYHAVYKHANQPLVSIIIPTKDRADLIIPCIDTLLDKTTYKNFEVLVVDNGSVVDDIHDYYADLQIKYPNKFRVIAYNQVFNYSAMNNLAAEKAHGDYLLLLNNDTEVVHDNWLDTMMNHAQRKDVGIVGARLIYRDKKLQHTGMVLGLVNVADNTHYRQHMDDETSLSASFVDRNVSAVSSACLLIRKQVFDDVGGLDEEDLKITYNNVDLCLKVTGRGFSIVWTPFATLIHHESSGHIKHSQHDEAADREVNTMLNRWMPQLSQDHLYNRNLSLMSVNAAVELDLIPGWNVDFHDRLRLLGFPLDGLGCGYYRVYAPLWALESHAKAEIAFVPEHDASSCPRIPSLPELARMAPDTLLLQSTLKDNQLGILEQYGIFSAAFKVFDLDDLKTNLPESNSRKKSTFKDIKYRLKQGLALCDRLIVSTEPLKDAYAHWIDDVIIVPNRLEKSRWFNFDSAINDGTKPRVGWAGAQQHHGDLRILIDVVKATHKEVDWVFFGLCLDELRPFIAEEHAFVSPNDYPAKLASLKLDLAVAPLEQNRFNEAKSNLRLLEYGAMGWPVVCSDIFPYQGAPVTTLVEEAPQWIDAIMDRIRSPEQARAEGHSLKKWVLDNWILEDHLDDWLTALTP